MDTQASIASPACPSCPSCHSPMQAFRCQRKLNGEVTVDICFTCQAIWFDEFESLQMAPSGILELFQRIHQHAADLHQPWRDVLACPRCNERLLQGFDLSKNGKFTYHRCLQKHGRFTAFSAFLMEKGFVRQLNGGEIDALAKKVQVIRCSGCGAPIDIRRETVCGHCRAPIAILDPQAVEKALAGFRQASAPAQVAPEAFADALLANERLKSKAALQRQTTKSSVVDGEFTDLVLGGAELVWELFQG